MHTSLALPEALPTPVSQDHIGVSRGRYVVLQALVGVMLGYQLLCGPEPIVSRAMSEFIVGGLRNLLPGLAGS